MGQSLSNEKAASPSREELVKQLADRFAHRCFTPLELYSLRNTFDRLADQEQSVRYLKETTMTRFLEIPDTIGVGPVLFQMVSYLGAFPFFQDAPVVLGLEQLIMVVTVLTDRCRKVLASSGMDRRKLLFRSLAVYDRKFSEMSSSGPVRLKKEHDQVRTGQDRDAVSTGRSLSGSVVDEAGNDEDLGLDDDELVLAAFKLLDYIKPPRHGDVAITHIHRSFIPTDNFRKLVTLLLLIAPLDAQEGLSLYSSRLSVDELQNLRETADCILSAFLDVEQAPGVNFSRFLATIPALMPYMFDGLGTLFEHFLFHKNLDLHRHSDGRHQTVNLLQEPVQPLLGTGGSIMNPNILSQISFFIPGSSLFRKLRLLYSGDLDGFSMGSFESKVFNWRAPTILLVSGTRLPEEALHAHSGHASVFLSTLPSHRLPPDNTNRDEQGRLTFGVYLNQPWKYTHKESFGDGETILFQLQPVHDVFRASTVNKNYASFRKPSASVPLGGLSFGCPPPQPSQTYRRSNIVSLGPVSLVLEDSLEFGCFTHDYTSKGGAFQTSVARKFDFQERFEISSVEVWGCGGDEEARHQAERWAWEAREAEARKRLNLGTGDIEADRALLEMAGLVGSSRSGGSMA
ncbi:TLD-domain-containing protein [Thermothelomyces heterothallicus CBS 202.75]|uniref:TLD-domain-containing protein n=1 Tax=Thermothelomyces heterothallicus CBS 202.75 TaxID=1149848 RepID=UPI003743BB94